jgi:uncharacterized cupin superfamily protein
MTSKAIELAARLIRNFDSIEKEHQVRDPLYDTMCARLGLGTAARKLGASIDTVAPGKVSCPYHFHHAQEEMFIVLEGRGTMRVAGELLPIVAGDVIFIPTGPEYPHQMVNTSDAPLKYLSISTRETPEICEYPDSDKYSAMARLDDGAFFDAINRRGATLDYWDGEP